MKIAHTVYTNNINNDIVLNKHKVISITTFKRTAYACLLGQLWRVQVSVCRSFPVQFAPPYCGEGWEQVRDLVLWPNSHVTSQLDHVLHVDHCLSTTISNN